MLELFFDWFRCLKKCLWTIDYCTGLTIQDQSTANVCYAFLQIHHTAIRINPKHWPYLTLCDLIWSPYRSQFHFYISASFVCNNLDNTVRRDYHNRCKKWKNAWGDKPECCTKCQSNWRTCYDECNEEIDLTPPGNIVFCWIHKL